MSRSLRPAVLAAVLSLALPAAAHAATPRFPAIALKAPTQRGSFSGALDVERFVVRGTQLRAVGRLTGTVQDRRYPGPQPVDEDYALTLAITPVATPTDCARVGLAFTARTRRFVGLRATIPGRLLVIKPRGPEAAAMREVLCAATAVLAATPAPVAGQPPVAPSPIFVRLLNALRLIAA
jgi:hypothetical protein